MAYLFIIALDNPNTPVGISKAFNRKKEITKLIGS